ncbi:hypothetical protein GOP47_0021750 [Adiantum capillus-veneris]|uniref:Uncharacterized protein n=1 Tax=Adiantum capillus-veneris TaxID=13818 RepID=A0A9D4Z5J0_ADICA|nr:hypothetical protein GOP47_0021750 [Adiantum capillus-veneris]
MACSVSQACGLLSGGDLLHSNPSQSALSFSSTFLSLRRGSVLSSTQHRLSWTSGRSRNKLSCRSSYGGAANALSPELKEAVNTFLTSNKVVLFMKDAFCHENLLELAHISSALHRWRILWRLRHYFGGIQERGAAGNN